MGIWYVSKLFGSEKNRDYNDAIDGIGVSNTETGESKNFMFCNGGYDDIVRYFGFAPFGFFKEVSFVSHIEDFSLYSLIEFEGVEELKDITILDENKMDDFRVLYFSYSIIDQACSLPNALLYLKKNWISPIVDDKIVISIDYLRLTYKILNMQKFNALLAKMLLLR